MVSDQYNDKSKNEHMEYNEESSSDEIEDLVVKKNRSS